MLSKAVIVVLFSGTFQPGIGLFAHCDQFGAERPLKPHLIKTRKHLTFALGNQADRQIGGNVALLPQKLIDRAGSLPSRTLALESPIAESPDEG